MFPKYLQTCYGILYALVQTKQLFAEPLTQSLEMYSVKCHLIPLYTANC